LENAQRPGVENTGRYAMRLPISWLKEYVEFEDTPRGLADKLTFSGTEVEGLEVFGTRTRTS
jgi:hypothetical protein